MGLQAVSLYRQIPNSSRNEFTYVCVLNACSHSGLLDEARSIFNEINIKTDRIMTTMVCLLILLILLLSISIIILL
jgi:pentatricopeptide repeat protein